MTETAKYLNRKHAMEEQNEYNQLQQLPETPQASTGAASCGLGRGPLRTPITLGLIWPRTEDLTATVSPG